MINEANTVGARPESAPDDTGRSNDESDGSRPSPAPASAGERGAGLWQKLTRIFFPPADRESLREDLTDALQSGGDLHEAFTAGERAMLHNILRLREIRVEDVEAVEQSLSISALLEHFEESGRSRMPVYCETLDDPRGMVHIRDLLAWLTKQARAKRKPAAKNGAATRKAVLSALDLSRIDLSKSLIDAGIVRKVLFVPASMHASDLMQHMQAARIQMALVIDEYGGTDGLVSLEDIVEMVVGDIADEHDDDDETMIERRGDDAWIVDAKAELEDIAEEIGPDFDIREPSEDVDTLGGLIFAELGRIPARGEVIQALPGFEFHVLDADPRRIKKVRVVRRRPAARRRPSRPDQGPGGAASQSEEMAG